MFSVVCYNQTRFVAGRTAQTTFDFGMMTEFFLVLQAVEAPMC